MTAPGLHYPPHPPPAADLHARAVWHAQARAWWRAAAAAARPRSADRRNALAWASQHEARVVALAWAVTTAAHNAPIATDPSPDHANLD